MKKVLQVIAIAAVLMMSEIAFSQTVVWKDIRWDAYRAARIALNRDGHLEVSPTGYYGGAAHHSTPNDFRTARTPWVEVNFYDDALTCTQLVMLDKGRAYTEFGISRSHKNYVIYWYNYQSGRSGLVGTAVARTRGLHTIKLAIQENGTVDYWIDNARVWSTNNINPHNFEDIYLTAQASTGTFVDYQFGIDYSPPLWTVEIEIDIKPGSDPNSINPKSKGVMPVAILTTETFDATTVDPLTVEFGPDGATEAHGKGHIEDVDGDSDLDLVLHFKVQDTGIACGDTSASLTGETPGGEPIEGSDSINTVGCK